MAFDYANGMPLLSEGDSPFSSGGDLLGLIGGATGSPWLSAVGGLSKMLGGSNKSKSNTENLSTLNTASGFSSLQGANFAGFQFGDGGSYNKPILDLQNPLHIMLLGGLVLGGVYLYKKVK